MTDNDPAQLDVRDLALAMVCLSYANTQVTAAMKRLREQGKTQLVPKESIAALSPVDGTVLGTITRTKPERVAKVVDEAALMAHIHDTCPDGLEDVHVVAATTEQVIDVLRVHAPHLLESRVEIRPYALAAALRSALEGNDTPGVQVDQPVGTVNTYPDKEAGEAIQAVIRAGRVSLDGTVVKLIEGEKE